MANRRVAIIGVGLLASWSGASVDARPPSAVVRDCAGVRIVEHRNLRTGANRLRPREPAMLELGADRPNEAKSFDVRRPKLGAVEITTGLVGRQQPDAAQVLLAGGCSAACSRQARERTW